MRLIRPLQACLLAAAFLFASSSLPAQTLFGAGTAKSVGANLSPASKELAGKIYDELIPSNSAAEIGNVAVSLWMIGRLQVALELMGRAIALDPANTDNQCNYAAMLTMSGGASQAIPVLEGLAKKFPENPTVLNNLGQAYFQTGDEEKAQKVLGRVLAVAPRHAQAAATQSEIAEGKGDTAQAVALAKQALAGGVTQDKLNRLRKLRYKVTLDDLKELRPTDPDPLGLHNFTHPAFPTNAVEEKGTHRDWAEFYSELDKRLNSLYKKLNTLQAPLLAAAQAKALAAYAQISGGNLPGGATASSGQSASIGTVQVQADGSATKTVTVVKPFARKAQLMLDLLDRDSGAKFRMKQAKDTLTALLEKNRELVKTEYLAERDKLLRQEANQTGEGLANADHCDKFVALADKYLAKWSDGREGAFNEYLHQLRLKLSEEVYWKQFIEPQEVFAVTVVQAQIDWLGAFKQSGIDGFGYMGIEVDESCLKKKQAGRGGKLTNFNDVHCQYHSELNLGIGKIVTDCEKMVSTLGVGPVKLGMEQDMDKGTDLYDNFVKCTVEVTVGKSAGAHVGPVSVEVGAEAGMGVEVGRNGIEDVYVTGKVEASVMNVVGTGAEARMSLVSGSGSVNMI